MRCLRCRQKAGNQSGRVFDEHVVRGVAREFVSGNHRVYVVGELGRERRRRGKGEVVVRRCRAAKLCGRRRGVCVPSATIGELCGESRVAEMWLSIKDVKD